MEVLFCMEALDFFLGNMADKMANTLEEAARKRKEKLAELRKKAKAVC